jgi:hypothetical protein
LTDTAKPVVGGQGTGFEPRLVNAYSAVKSAGAVVVSGGSGREQAKR